MKLLGVLLVLLACAAGASHPAAAGAEGRLDSSFGDHGTVDLDSGQDDRTRTGVVAVGPRGEIFVTEEASVCGDAGCKERVYLKRYRADGSLDRSFGGGRVSVGQAATYAALTVDAAGRPLLAFDHEGAFTVRRFRSDGDRDTSFGDSGSVRIRCECYLSSIEAGPGGKPLLIASADFKRTSPFRGVIWVLVRLRSDGTRDRSFGRGGLVRKPMPGFSETAARIGKGGRALLYGFGCCRYPLRPFVQRLSKRGGLDRRYAAETKRSLHGLYGTRREDLPWEGIAVVPRSRGRVEVFGSAYEHGVAVRLRGDGSRDPSFGAAGVRKYNFEVWDAVSDGAGGSLLVAWVSGKGYAVKRTVADGGLDREFGTVMLPRASNEGGLSIFDQGGGAAIVFDRGIPFCRSACEVDPKLYRVLAGGR